MITFFLPSPLGGEGSGVRGKSPQKPSPHPNPSPPRGEGLSRFLRVGRARLADGTARVGVVAFLADANLAAVGLVAAAGLGAAAARWAVQQHVGEIDRHL